MVVKKGKSKKAKAEAVVKVTPEVVEADDILVEDAVIWINDKVKANVHGTYLEIGDYVFDKFYGGDLNQVKSFNPHKESSFQKLSERKDLLISRSHLHRAVHVAIQEKHLLPTFPSMGGLTFTHKAALLPVKSLEMKQELVSQAIEENLSVSELKERVKEAQGKEPKSPAGRPTLPGFQKSVKRAYHVLGKEGSLEGLTEVSLKKDEAIELREKVKHMISALGQISDVLTGIIEGEE